MGQRRLWSLPFFWNVSNNLCHDCGRERQTNVTLLTQYGVKVGELIKSTDEHFSIKWMILKRSLRFAELIFGDSLPKITKLMGRLKPNSKKVQASNCTARLSGTNQPDSQVPTTNQPSQHINSITPFFGYPFFTGLASSRGQWHLLRQSLKAQRLTHYSDPTAHFESWFLCGTPGWPTVEGHGPTIRPFFFLTKKNPIPKRLPATSGEFFGLKAKILHGPKPDNHCIRQHHSKPLRPKKSSHHPPFTQKLYIKLPKLEKAYKYLISSSTHFAARNFSFQNFLAEKVRGVTWKRKVCGFPSCEIAYLRGRPSLQLPSFQGEDGHWIKRLKPNFPHEIFSSLFLLSPLFKKRNATKNSRFWIFDTVFPVSIFGRNHNFLNQNHPPEPAPWLFGSIVGHTQGCKQTPQDSVSNGLTHVVTEIGS